jgi:hypothetical protein
VIANNIFYEYGKSPDGQIGLNVYPSVTGSVMVRNNNFWDPIVQAGDSYGKAARYKNGLGNPAYSGNYTAAQLNSACSTTCMDNTQIDPLFEDPTNRDYRIRSSGAASVRTGGYDYNSVMDRGYTDFFGTPFTQNSVSRGAIQYPGVARTNLSAGIAPTFNAGASDPPPSKLTNGNTASTDYVTVGYADQLVYAQIDLGALKDISQIKMWHYHSDGRTYKDVIVQLSRTPDFNNATTVFNNDKDNSAAQGYGSDDEYAETADGKTLTFAPVTARYARFWLKGNSVNANSNFVELQVFGTDPIAKLVSQYQDVTYSDGVADTADPEPSNLTDGYVNAADKINAGTGLVHATIDLGSSVTMNKINMWRDSGGGARQYHDVIVQISNDADFSNPVTVFNNDSNNSASQGTGTDAEYAESGSGKTISFAPIQGRYVRFWSNGYKEGTTEYSSSPLVELEVYGY